MAPSTSSEKVPHAESSVQEAYRRGHVEFMGIELAVAPGVFVPRKETELLGRAALDALTELRGASPRVIDMCCGSGNLACTIASHVDGARIWASDLTESCVALARANVRKLALETRVSVHQGDLFEGLRGIGLEGSIDLVVCNPPYVPVRRLHGDRAHLIAHEPREAFDGGPYGFDVLLRLLKDAPEFLRPGGLLLFEISLGQERQALLLFERARVYDPVQVLDGSAGEMRVVRGRRK